MVQAWKRSGQSKEYAVTNWDPSQSSSSEACSALFVDVHRSGSIPLCLHGGQGALAALRLAGPTTLACAAGSAGCRAPGDQSLSLHPCQSHASPRWASTPVLLPPTSSSQLQHEGPLFALGPPLILPPVRPFPAFHPCQSYAPPSCTPSSSCRPLVYVAPLTQRPTG